MNPGQNRIFRSLSLAIVLACAFHVPNSEAAVGSWSTTGPFGGANDFLAVYEAGPSTLFAAGRGGLFRSLSAGTAWQRIEVGLPDALYVQSLSSSTVAPVLYVSSFYGLYRSGNAGDLWVPIGTPLPAGHVIRDVHVRRATSNSLAIATSNGAYVSTNAGGTWTAVGASGTSAQFSQILFAADGNLYLGLEFADVANFGGASLLKSTDGGIVWNPLPAQPPGFFGIDGLVESPLDPQRLYVSFGTEVATSANGGASWAAVSTPAGGAGCGRVTALTAHPTVATGLFIGCQNNGVHFTANVGAPAWTSWTAANALTANGTDPVQASEIAVHPGFPATNTLWTGTTDGGLFRTTNGGATWAAVNNGYQSANIRALAAHPLDTNPAGAVVLAGLGDAFTTSQAIYKSSDGGTSWAPSLSGLNAEQIRWMTIDPTTVDANPFTAENFTVYASGRSERIPVSTSKDGGIYKSTDAGATWTTIDNGISIFGGTPNMGTVRAIVLDPDSCAAPPCAAGSSPLQIVYAAGSGIPGDPGLPYQSARIYKSTNAGASWTASESGLPPTEDLGPPGTFTYLSSIVVPLVIDPDTTSTLYAGTVTAWFNGLGSAPPTLANGVFKSTDGGATWVHSSNGLPRLAGPGSSHHDVLALAINPANPATLYAGVTSFASDGASGSIYKSTDGGANWFESGTGIAGQDVRALFLDPADASGDTIYAGTGGDGADPGGVYRSTDGGATWNSLSIGLPANAALALTVPPRGVGDPARIVAGTTAGIWEYTATPDEDVDGSPSAIENGVLSGDGNGDGTADATQSEVASLSAIGSSAPGSAGPSGTIVRSTIEVVGGTCTQLNDSVNQQAELYPPDPVGTPDAHTPWGLIGFSLPDCSLATIRVTFHDGAFDANWRWRNYGPRIPGDPASFAWYSFAGARRIDGQTWELDIDASRQGNYRDDAENILFKGGPALLPDVIFDNGFE